MDDLGGENPLIFGNTHILDTSQNLWLLGKPTTLGNPLIYTLDFFRMGRLRLDGPHDQGLTPSAITRRKDLQTKAGFFGGGPRKIPGGVHEPPWFLFRAVQWDVV